MAGEHVDHRQQQQEPMSVRLARRSTVGHRYRLFDGCGGVCVGCRPRFVAEADGAEVVVGDGVLAPARAPPVLGGDCGRTGSAGTVGDGVESPAPAWWPTSGKPGTWTFDAPDTATTSSTRLATRIVARAEPTTTAMRRRRPDRSTKTALSRVGRTSRRGVVIVLSESMERARV
jgi:hypothetical protein